MTIQLQAYQMITLIMVIQIIGLVLGYALYLLENNHKQSNNDQNRFLYITDFLDKNEIIKPYDKDISIDEAIKNLILINFIID